MLYARCSKQPHALFKLDGKDLQPSLACPSLGPPPLCAFLIASSIAFAACMDPAGWLPGSVCNLNWTPPPPLARTCARAELTSSTAVRAATPGSSGPNESARCEGRTGVGVPFGDGVAEITPPSSLPADVRPSRSCECTGDC